MLVYRGGTQTDNNLTPKAKDAATGFSVNESANVTGKCQCIDTDRLPSSLQYRPDDPGDPAFVPGHGVIVPVDTTGEVDRAALSAWVASHDSGTAHELTVAVRGAVIRELRNGQ